jgi:hypothetical protein
MSVTTDTDKELNTAEPTIITESSDTKVVDAEKVNELLRNITLDSDKFGVLCCLHENIKSIKLTTFINMITYNYDVEKQNSFSELFFNKIDGIIDAKTIELVIDKLSGDKNKLSFCTTHKDFLMNNVENFDKKTIATKFIQKTMRNSFYELFDMPLEIIQNRGEGFEVFGIFISNDTIDIGDTITCNVPYDETGYVKITKKKNNRFTIDAEYTTNKDGYSYMSTTRIFDGVWIYDENGLHRE